MWGQVLGKHDFLKSGIRHLRGEHSGHVMESFHHATIIHQCLFVILKKCSLFLKKETTPYSCLLIML